MEFPRLLLVRQNFPDRSIPDIRSAVSRELTNSPFSSRLKPGARVAIGVGSRGINNIATIVRSMVDFWKSKGAQPFIFPAMGSHGAASLQSGAALTHGFEIAFYVLAGLALLGAVAAAVLVEPKPKTEEVETVHVEAPVLEPA